MCGRARCTLRADDIPRACYRTAAPTRLQSIDRYRPSHNVSPGFNVPVVRREDASDSDGYVLHCMKWGLIPSFTKKTEKADHYRMFNARSESLNEKASFRRLVPKNRCLVAVEGFYEWKKDGSKKQPYYIHFKDGRPLVFAALYDSWQNSEGELLYTFTIVTTSSSSSLQWLHDRMPVILGDKDSTDTWLSSPPSSCKNVMKPYEESDLVWYPVTPAMGKPSFDGPECIKEIQVKAEGNNSISKFFSRKGAESEDTKPEHKILSQEFVKTEHTKDLSEEVKKEEGDEDDLKPSASSLSQNVTKFPIKREFDDFAADSKPILANDAQVSANPAKKKEKTKTTDDKQPTLFSYFGKRYDDDAQRGQEHISDDADPSSSDGDSMFDSEEEGDEVPQERVVEAWEVFALVEETEEEYRRNRGFPDDLSLIGDVYGSHRGCLVWQGFGDDVSWAWWTWRNEC